MTRLSTHVLDTAAGEPLASIGVVLARGEDGRHFTQVARAETDADGRITDFPEIEPGRWQLVFATQTPFFPEVVVTFEVPAGREHLHVPLLLSPYGYSVYRGS